MISAEAVTLRGRVAAEALMIDSCLVERSTGEVTDPVTGVVSEGWETVYTGVCKVQGRQAQAASPVAGGHAFTVEQLMIHLPVSAQSRLDDRVTIVTATMDPDLVGATFRLTELARGTYRTAYRWNVEAVTG